MQPPTSERSTMRMVNFVEGALSRKGGIGIVGIPVILGEPRAEGIG